MNAPLLPTYIYEGVETLILHFEESSHLWAQARVDLNSKAEAREEGAEEKDQMASSEQKLFWNSSDMESNEELVEQTRESLEGLRNYVAANVHPDKLK